jgi:RNA polymerase sigma-70 factor (ECF subfamily)
MINRRKKYQRASDEDLAAILSKEENNLALAEIYRRYGHLVLGLCLKYLKQPADAEDMASHIFTQLQKKLADKRIDTFKSWLFIVSKNECLMKLRKKSYNHIAIKEELLSEPSDQQTDKLNQELKYEELEDAINELEEEQALVIKQFYLEQQSYKSISESFNIPLKKVKSAIQNGKRNLRIKLEQHDLFKSA